MKSAPHQASYTSTLDHLVISVQTLKRERERKGGETLSYTHLLFLSRKILRLHSFRFNECTHVYSEEESSNNAKGEEEYPEDDDEASNIHLL